MAQTDKPSTSKRSALQTGRGGARVGAGRKKGSGRFGESTKVMRIPTSKVTLVQQWLDQTYRAQPPKSTELSWATPDLSQPVYLPLLSHKVTAGFPSPADDYVETQLDLNQKLIRNPTTTFLVTVQGDSMQNAGIEKGDILIVDRSQTPQAGDIVIASVYDEVTVKRLKLEQNCLWLLPENPKYPPIRVDQQEHVTLWGVVTATIKQF